MWYKWMESVVNDNFNELNLRCVSSGIIAFPFIRMTHSPKYFSEYTMYDGTALLFIIFYMFILFFFCFLLLLFFPTFVSLRCALALAATSCTSRQSAASAVEENGKRRKRRRRKPIFSMSSFILRWLLASPSPKAIVVEFHVLYSHCLRWV